MVLDESHERLYVGAKNTLFSLSLDQLNKDQREVRLFSRCVCQEARHIELRHSGGDRLAKQPRLTKLYVYHYGSYLVDTCANGDV